MTTPPSPPAPAHAHPTTTRILTASHACAIDLSILPFTPTALSSIAALSLPPPTPLRPLDFTSATRIDTHTHPIPPWFRLLSPTAAGRPTPEWTPAAHLAFMASHDITRSVLSVSTPQANAFLDELDGAVRRAKTVALARLLNEYVAEVCRVWPQRFVFLAVLPLPYVDDAVAEARYALEELGAVGVAVMSNHEGVYPGAEFGALWEFLSSRSQSTSSAENAEENQVIFIHPTDPVIRLPNGTFHPSNPSPLRSGLGEFYFETARALSVLTSSGTLTAYPNLHYRVSHGAGAFPDIHTRFLLSLSPADAAAARKAYRERLWYDSAGPVWPGQIRGVLDGLGVGVEQCVFGTDWPYGVGFWDVGENIDGLVRAEGLAEGEREGVEGGNAQRLWGGRV